MLFGARRFLLLLAVLPWTASCTQSEPPPHLAGQDIHLTILHTADIHSRLFPYQFAPGQIDKGLGLEPSHGRIAVVGGAARIATVVKRERAASGRFIHIDSGDMFQGAPIFNMFSGEPETRMMSRLGVNAMALGNHELDKGALNLALMKTAWGSFPLLGANYIFSDPADPAQPKLRNVIQPYAIVNVQGLRVGIIGMGNVDTIIGILEGGNSLGMRPLDTQQTIRDMVRLLRPQVDLLLIASHLGLDADEQAAQATNGDGIDENTKAAIDGVDVILGGHLHIVLNPPKDLPRVNEKGEETGHTILCHSGAFAKYVGRLDLVVHVADPDGQTAEDKKSYVKSYTFKVIPIDDHIPEDPEMVRLLEPYQLKLNTRFNLTDSFAVVPCPANVGTCPKVQRMDPDGGDSQLGNLVATSMRFRRRVDADFALTNTLGIRTDFESGPLNLEQMYNVFPFENTITTMFLSGTEIEQTLDFNVSRSADRGCKTQAQVSGIWYLMDCRKDPDPVKKVFPIACGPFDATGAPATHCNSQDRTLDGPFLLGDDCLDHPEGCRQVLPNGEYRAAVNDYIANGGSGFIVLKRNTSKFNTGISLRDALIDHIRMLPNRCDSADNSNIVSNDLDLSEEVRACTFQDPAAGIDGELLGSECGQIPCAVNDPTTGALWPSGCRICDDPDNPKLDRGQPFDFSRPFRPVCLRHHDYANLPCLTFDIQKHDGRIGRGR